MKNFNIFWVHFFRGGGVFTKNQYRGRRLSKKGGGFGQLADLRGGGAWQEREGNVFEGKG